MSLETGNSTYQRRRTDRGGTVTADITGVVDRAIREHTPPDELNLREGDDRAALVTAARDSFAARTRENAALFGFELKELGRGAQEPAQPQATESTREAAGSFVAGEPAARKTATPRVLGFREARDFLRTHGIDLEQHREEAVREALRWGLVDSRSAADKYGAMFDDIEPVSEADLNGVRSKEEIIFGVDDMTLKQGFQKLIVQAGIRSYSRRLSEYRRVDAQSRQPLRDQQPSGKAGVLFTSGILNLPANLLKISPNAQLEKKAQGQKYMGPVGWMLMFRRCVDRALPKLYPEEAANIDALPPDQYKELVTKALLDSRIDQYLPDVRTGTQFCDRRRNDGAVLYFRFYPRGDYRYVDAYGCCPGGPHVSLGGRPAPGSLLS